MIHDTEAKKARGYRSELPTREIPKERTCAQCGAAFVNHYRRVRFCSPKCWYESRREARKFKPCPICGKLFYPNSQGVSRGRQRTCSQKCGGVLRRRGSPKRCATCGKEFWQYPSNRARKFCSMKCACAASWQQVPVRCVNCGKTFYRGRALVKRVKNTFCNRACFQAFYRGPQSGQWRGGNRHFRGKDWARQQRRARKRDQNICQVCGAPKKKGEALSVDHIIPYRMFPSNHLDNLISLCRGPCHAEKTAAIEPHILRGDRLGFIQSARERRWPIERVEKALALFERSPQLAFDHRKIRWTKKTA